MEELIAQITAIAKGMWRFRWQSLLVAWIVGIIAAVVVFRIPDRYEASARIYVDTQSILKPLMSGLAVQPNVEQQIVMLSRTLISRPNIEKLVRMADLDLKADTKEQQDALIAELMKTLVIGNTNRDNLYTLSYQNSDPGKAQRVIQSLVSIFVESSLGATKRDTATAKQFINEQIKAYEAKLEEAETRLKEFRIKNIDLQSGDGRDTASRIAALREQLEEAKLALRESELARDSAKAQLKGERVPAAGGPAASGASAASPSPAPEPPIATPEIDARIEAQKKNLDALLQRFTDQHPDVVNTRRLIRDLEEQKRKEVEELRHAAASLPATPGGSTESAAYQALSSMLANAEVQVAGLRARVAEYSARYEQARQSLKTAPQIEAAAAQLNRDYAINKRNYEDLVARRESAAMSGELEGTSSLADFRLIDPPRVSPRPVAPNRLLLLWIAFVVTLASGLLTAFAASQLRPVFHSAGDLRMLLELPVLGVVSRVTSFAEDRKAKMDRMRFVAGSGSLIGIFLTAMATMAIIAARAPG
jgi:polysaccharide chain length determinant protein (PEP-CTERM system associated)